ncbi:hypothetical protein DV736_g3868, partial [Chaetothyriales sp. CBS 134916]
MLISYLVFVLLAAQVSALRNPIWPQPVHLELGDRIIWLGHPLYVNVSCADEEPMTWTVYKPGSRTERWRQVKHNVLATVSSLVVQAIPFKNFFREPDCFSERQILRSALNRAVQSIYLQHLVPWKFHSRHSQFEPEHTDAGSKLTSLLVIQTHCPSTTFSPKDFFGSDESYELDIRGSQATIHCNSTMGALRALESFQQLFYSHTSRKAVYSPYSPTRIWDLPYWSHRGLSLDIARNSFTLADVKRTIDGMAACKMSRLHLHATDSQSWPIEVPSLPELARQGAYQPHLVWTAGDLDCLQRYGASRGVMVFLELDMPGHTASIAYAYPDLIAAFNELDWSTFAAEPQSGQLKLDSDHVRAFLDILLEDILPRVAAYSSHYHLGGDEVNSQVHLLDETVRSNETAVLRPLIQRYLDQAMAHVNRHALRPVVWEEMVLDWDLNVSMSCPGSRQDQLLVQVWRDPVRIEEVLKKGHHVIFGDSKHWYLDCGFGQFLDPYPAGSSPPGVPYNSSGGRPSRLDSRFLDYCQPYHNWRTVYTFNPLEGVNESLHDGIEGGEVLMWSEQTDFVDLDVKLWPRTAAAAEVLWSGPRTREQIAAATWRLGHLRERLWFDHRISSSPVQMTWCLMEGGCEY